MISSQRHSNVIRLSSLILTLFAIVSVVVSFSRSAWLVTAIALMIAWYVHVFVWRERQILQPTAFAALLLVILSPWILDIVIERFTSAEGLLSARFDQFPIAFRIWKDHFLFGYGVGNYMEALKIYNETGVIELPVHNVFLWLGAETGVVGVIAYYSLVFAALTRLWRVLKERYAPTYRLALAVFCALIAYILDGLTDPLYREPVVYMMFWLSIALSVALRRMNQQEEQRVMDNSYFITSR